MPLFTPPSRTAVPPILPRDGDTQTPLGRRLFRHYRSRPEGISVFLLSDSTLTESYPDSERVFWSKADGTPYVVYAFYGGHDDYEITQSIADLLTAAGYTVTDVVPPTPDPPTITSLAPSSGVTGTTVTVNGSNLSLVTGVHVGVSTPTPTVLSSTQVRFAAPSKGDGTYDVTVTNPYGTSNILSFTYATPAPNDPPVISNVSPSSGVIGITVTLTGTSFDTVSALTVDGVGTAFNVVSASSITFTAPSHADGAVNLILTNPGGTSNTVTFTYTSVAPPSDPHPGNDILAEDSSFILAEDGTSTIQAES